jgi:hypothetical protein
MRLLESLTEPLTGLTEISLNDLQWFYQDLILNCTKKWLRLLDGSATEGISSQFLQGAID